MYALWSSYEVPERWRVGRSFDAAFGLAQDDKVIVLDYSKLKVYPYGMDVILSGVEGSPRPQAILFAQIPPVRIHLPDQVFFLASDPSF